MKTALIRLALVLLHLTTVGFASAGCGQSEEPAVPAGSPRRPSYYHSPLGPRIEPRQLPARDAPSEDRGVLRPIGE
jgi:hypothetical protein